MKIKEEFLFQKPFKTLSKMSCVYMHINIYKSTLLPQVATSISDSNWCWWLFFFLLLIWWLCDDIWLVVHAQIKCISEHFFRVDQFQNQWIPVLHIKTHLFRMRWVQMPAKYPNCDFQYHEFQCNCYQILAHFLRSMDWTISAIMSLN